MFSNEVIPMAVKKSAPKGGAKKAKAAKKAAPKKAAKKSAPKRSAPKKAAPKASAKKAAPRKAAAVKLTDIQKGLLKQVMDTKLNGLLASKPNAKALGALLAKKLIKKGKKEGEYFRYFITKLGEKHAPVVVVVAEPAPVPPM
jgi:hypothetical protein